MWLPKHSHLTICNAFGSVVGAPVYPWTGFEAQQLGIETSTESNALGLYMYLHIWVGCWCTCVSSDGFLKHNNWESRLRPNQMCCNFYWMEIEYPPEPNSNAKLLPSAFCGFFHRRRTAHGKQANFITPAFTHMHSNKPELLIWAWNCFRLRFVCFFRLRQKSHGKKTNFHYVCIHTCKFQ